MCVCVCVCVCTHVSVCLKMCCVSTSQFDDTYATNLKLLFIALMTFSVYVPRAELPPPSPPVPQPNSVILIQKLSLPLSLPLTLRTPHLQTPLTLTYTHTYTHLHPHLHPPTHPPTHTPHPIHPSMHAHTTTYHA